MILWKNLLKKDLEKKKEQDAYSGRWDGTRAEERQGTKAIKKTE